MSASPSSSPKTGSFRRGLFSSSFGTALSVVFLFLETAIASRVLSETELGTYFTLVLVTMFLVIVSDFGSKTTITRYLAGSEADQRAAYTQTAILFRVIVVVAISLLVWLVPSVLLIFEPNGSLTPYAHYIPLLLIPASLDELLLSVLQGFKAYRSMAAMQILRSAIRIGVSWALLVVWNIGIAALLFSWGISYAASVAYAYAVMPTSKRPAYRHGMLAEMLRFGFPIHMNRFVGFAFRRVDLWLLSLLAGPSAVAFYAVATRIPDALQRLSESFTAVYFPAVSSLLAKGKRDEAGAMLSTSIRLISFVTAGGALVAIVFGSEIVRLIFSDKYAASTIAFGVFMLVFHVVFITNLIGYTLTAAGYATRSLGGDLARTVLNVIGDLLLIPIFSFVGPAYATLAATYGTHPLMLWLLRRSDIHISVAPYLKQTALLLGGAALFWWLQPQLIVYKLAFVIAFGALNALLGTVRPDDLNLLLTERITRRIPLMKRLQSQNAK